VSGSAQRRPPRGGRRRTQAERSLASRAQILDAALGCVAEQGFRRTNLARIAERAGLSLGAIQHQFGGKAGVLAAAVEHGFDRLLGVMARRPDGSGDLRRRVRRLVRSVWRHYGLPESRAALEIVLQMRAEPEFLAQALPYLAEIRGAIDRMWMGLFADVGAPRRRHIRAQRLLFTTLNGLAIEATLVPGPPDPGPDLDALADGILRILAGDRSGRGR
jgi:AcrR family transcriptional regulator